MQRTAIFLIGALLGLAWPECRNVAVAQPAALPYINDARVQTAGIRKLTSEHLVLYTDLPADAEVDRLPAVFDQAVPQWAKYFEIDVARTRDWQARGFLIKDRQKFDAAGQMPPLGYDKFLNGISIGNQLWLKEQPTVYYRRHLLLHEGTHVFMSHFLGGCGPGWYMEGMAELLATHRIDEAGRLTLRTMPADREEVAMLGRIKLVRDAFAAGRPLSLPAVMQIDNRRVLENEAYAWSWAATAFLDSHPRYRDRFRALRKHVTDVRFNEFANRDYEADLGDLTNEWRAFVATLDHGFDFERMAIDFRRGEPIAAGGRKTVTINSDRGWQSSGVWLAAGQTYHITASGRYQIAEETLPDGKRQPWPCEPGGVTIDYYAGRPLGILVGAIDAREAESLEDTFAKPFAIGLDATVTPKVSGTLYLRVNDSAGRLGDNRGTLSATVEAK